MNWTFWKFAMHSPAATRSAICLLAVVGAALAGGCGNKPPAPPDLTQAILEATRDTGVVEFAFAFPGEWDRLFIVPPYTSESEARRIVGADWPGYWGADIATRGDITLVVFLGRTNTVTAGGIVKRYALDMNPAFRLGGYGRAEARFRFVDKSAVLVTGASP